MSRRVTTVVIGATVGVAAIVGIGWALIDSDHDANRRAHVPPTITTGDRFRKGTRIPLGWFQSTVSLEPAQALGGSVKLGERVTVLAETGVVARDAIVTNVQIDGASRTQAMSAPTGKFLVTLAVPEDDLERIVVATSEGEIWLAR
jgi:hypothetical protein